jgi:hypothetical protein
MSVWHSAQYQQRPDAVGPPPIPMPIREHTPMAYHKGAEVETRVKRAVVAARCHLIARPRARRAVTWLMRVGRLAHA